MPDENANIIDALFEAWNRRDFEDGVDRYVDPDVDFNPGLVPPGEGTQFRGREGVKEWMRTVNDSWVAVTIEPGERIDIGADRLLSIDRWHFEGRDGIEVEEELPTEFAFRDGLVVRVRGFTSRPEAEAALGLDL
jgi:ketosteroid isomerase-like protein